MKKLGSKLSLATLLASIAEYDLKQVEAQYNIANMLTAIRDHNLYKELDYETFPQMCEGELEFGYRTASNYVQFYANLERLKYTKEEALQLMQRYTWRALSKVLTGEDKKIGTRAIKNRIDNREPDQYQNVAFQLADKRAVARLDSLLSRHGCQLTTEGRRINSTSALLALLDDYERLTKVKDVPKATRIAKAAA